MRCYNSLIVMNKKLTVRIPATSANMGPGFDCLGIALDIWNTVSILEDSLDSPGVMVIGNGQGELSSGTDNLIFQSFSHLFDELGEKTPNVTLECENRIPLARGMGSSSAALVGGLFAANEYAGKPLSQLDLLEIAAGLEGHPDNVASALLGGMQISVYEEGHMVTASVPFPESLSVVLYVPDTPMPTEEARGLLDSNVARSEAVFNIGRAALLVHAMSTGQLEYLRYATQDALHQPARQKIFFPMKNIIKAAMDSGGLGAFLSGSGSTVLAFCTDREYTIGYEMADAGMKSGLNGEIIVTSPTYGGAFLSS